MMQIQLEDPDPGRNSDPDSLSENVVQLDPDEGRKFFRWQRRHLNYCALPLGKEKALEKHTGQRRTLQTLQRDRRKTDTQARTSTFKVNTEFGRTTR